MANKTYLIGLDCGHGLKTSGKQTPCGIKEWTLNDDVRDRVVTYLKGYNVDFLFTDNNEGNTDESLSSRLNKYLNAKVDLFISIHHNACSGTWNQATGVEVFTDKNYTSADQRLAECIYPLLVKYTGLKGRGIKRENWYVINQNKIPAVLVEGGFMDSKIDYPVLTSDKGKDGYARAVAEGIIAYLGLTKTNTTTETKTLYRVGTSWSNGKCQNQVGAYSNKDNAIAKAKENDTWKVFDDKGNVVYPEVKTTTEVNVTYAVQIEGGKVLSEIKNLDDYAGIENKKITGITMKVDKGTIKYQVHVLGGDWLPYVTGYNWNDHNNGYAGNGKPIDAIRVYYTTPSDLTKNGDYREAKYHVSPIGSTSYYGWQLDDSNKNGMDGYAGNFGKAIDKVQIAIV